MVISLGVVIISCAQLGGKFILLLDIIQFFLYLDTLFSPVSEYFFKNVTA